MYKKIWVVSALDILKYWNLGYTGLMTLKFYISEHWTYVDEVYKWTNQYIISYVYNAYNASISGVTGLNLYAHY